MIVGGFLGGVGNALSGGGSFLTFPLLIWLGLPPQVANATNRIAIVLQCAAGSATYHRAGVMPYRDLLRTVVPMIAGAIPGAILASRIDEGRFRIVSAILLTLMIAGLFIDPKKWTRASSEGRIRPRHWVWLFLLGIYGGFLQVGSGTLVLGFLVLFAGFDVVRGNALKFGQAMVYNAVALALFAGVGQVDWWIGIVLAIGTMAGGAVGATLVVRQGARWVRWAVVASAILGVGKLLWR
ncbi:MAG: sulfite exporter TauE/SafE family protein [Candidatus Eisenbacteria bacterium]